MGSLAVSTIFTVVAICIPAHSYGEVSAKVGSAIKGLALISPDRLFYFGHLMQLVGIWLQVETQISSAHQYGTYGRMMWRATLIILWVQLSRDRAE